MRRHSSAFALALWKDQEDEILHLSFPHPILSHSETEAQLSGSLSSGTFAETKRMDLELSPFQAAGKAYAQEEMVTEKGPGSASEAREVASDSERFQVLRGGAGSRWVCGQRELRSISWGSG